MTRQRKIVIGTVVVALVIVAAAAVGYNMTSSKKTLAISTTTTTSSTTTTTSSTTTTKPPVVAPAGTPLPSGFEPQSASFVSSNIGFVLGISNCTGGPCLTIARTEDGGKTWLSIPAPATPLAQGPLLTSNSAAVSRIRFVNILDGYLYGPSFYATKDGGATWQKVTLSGAPSSYGVTSLETNGTTTYLIAGNPNTAIPGAELLYSSPATGDNFALQSQPTISPGWQPRIVTNPYGTVISMNDNKGDLYYQATGTASWTHLNPGCLNGIPTNPVVAVAAPVAGSSDPQIVLACGGDAGAGTQQKTVVKTTNLSTFTTAPSQPPLAGILDAIASPDGNTIAVAAASGATFLYLSTNGGSSWQTILNSPAFGGAPIHDLGFTTNSQGFAVEGNATKAGTVSSYFVMTHNAGLNWQQVTF
ncbi:MAG: hypothetical protein HKL84_07400 [Acidimicrobiaceae bacterium]|nr:hypothetical protein [Acidimicrobiaceae bacterium]